MGSRSPFLTDVGRMNICQRAAYNPFLSSSPVWRPFAEERSSVRDNVCTKTQALGAHLHRAPVLMLTELVQVPLFYPSQTEKMSFSNEDLLVQGTAP